MSDSETSEIVKLQELLLGRLEEFGMNAKATNNLARHLAHIAVLGRRFGENTLPLFLSLRAEHAHALFELVNAMKRDLDELRDAIQDLESDFPALIKAFAS
jgi:hypothetical protein